MEMLDAECDCRMQGNEQGCRGEYASVAMPSGIPYIV
jgi:hypothetical protein